MRAGSYLASPARRRRVVLPRSLAATQPSLLLLLLVARTRKNGEEGTGRRRHGGGICNRSGAEQSRAAQRMEEKVVVVVARWVRRFERGSLGGSFPPVPPLSFPLSSCVGPAPFPFLRGSHLGSPSWLGWAPPSSPVAFCGGGGVRTTVGSNVSGATSSSAEAAARPACSSIGRVRLPPRFLVVGLLLHGSFVFFFWVVKG